ncbi:MAG: FecR domain-containing protein [Novosphingobium sp.]|nr:FecR domain-containing protein [Novosphingobium sp.]
MKSPGMKPATDDAMLEQAANWLTRAREGMDDADRAAFLDWLRERPEHAAAADLVSRAWEVAPEAARQGGFKAPSFPSAVTAPVRRRPVMMSRGFVRGGLALGGMAAAVLAFWMVQPSEAGFATGQDRREVALADGTRVWLAPHSRIEARIGPLGRHVKLESGEAVFDVVHQSRGFTVDARDVSVVDKGTLFTVRNRPDRPVAVVLARGALEVRQGGSTLAEPRPGERVEIVAGKARVDEIDAEAAIAWREGRLLFSDCTLGEALSAFADQGAPRVTLDDPALAKLHVSGAYAVADLESFLSGLSSIHPLRWKRTGREYEVEPR